MKLLDTCLFFLAVCFAVLASDDGLQVRHCAPIHNHKEARCSVYIGRDPNVHNLVGWNWNVWVYDDLCQLVGGKYLQPSDIWYKTTLKGKKLQVDMPDAIPEKDRTGSDINGQDVAISYEDHGLSQAEIFTKNESQGMCKCLGWDDKCGGKQEAQSCCRCWFDC